MVFEEDLFVMLEAKSAIIVHNVKFTFGFFLDQSMYFYVIVERERERIIFSTEPLLNNQQTISCLLMCACNTLYMYRVVL